MLRNLWIDEFAPVRLEACQSAGLVLAHQLAVAGDIYREDGSQPPLDTCLSHADRPYPRDFVPSLWSGARCVY